MSYSLRLTGDTGDTGKGKIISPMGSLCLFLVENHEDTVRYIRLYLEQLDYKVCVAADMAAALREIPKSRCDVLISDIGLPDGDGWQLMEKLGKHRPQFAIAISGYGAVK